MKKILLPAIAALSFTACNEGKKDVIIGKWQLIDRTSTTDPAENVLPKDDTALVEFSESGEFISTSKRGSQIDTFGVGKFEILDGGKKMVSISSGNVDTAEILELSKNTFKVKAPDGVIITLKKVN